LEKGSFLALGRHRLTVFVLKEKEGARKKCQEGIYWCTGKRNDGDEKKRRLPAIEKKLHSRTLYTYHFYAKNESPGELKELLRWEGKKDITPPAVGRKKNACRKGKRRTTSEPPKRKTWAAVII